MSNERLVNLAYNRPFLLKVMKKSRKHISNNGYSYLCSHDGNLERVVLSSRMDGLVIGTTESYAYLYIHTGNGVYDFKSQITYWYVCNRDLLSQEEFLKKCSEFKMYVHKDEEFDRAFHKELNNTSYLDEDMQYQSLTSLLIDNQDFDRRKYLLFTALRTVDEDLPEKLNNVITELIDLF